MCVCVLSVWLAGSEPVRPCIWDWHSWQKLGTNIWTLVLGAIVNKRPVGSGGDSSPVSMNLPVSHYRDQRCSSYLSWFTMEFTTMQRTHNLKDSLLRFKSHQWHACTDNKVECCSNNFFLTEITFNIHWICQRGKERNLCWCDFFVFSLSLFFSYSE